MLQHSELGYSGPLVLLVCLLYQLGIDEDTPAVFADDDLLMELEVYLALGGDLVEATTTSIAVYGHDGQAVACPLTDTSEGMQQALLDVLLELEGRST